MTRPEQSAESVAPRRRLLACVEEWPDCETGLYDPRCCRFPKSCSCTVYDERYVTDADLEPAQFDGPAPLVEDADGSLICSRCGLAPSEHSDGGEHAPE